MWFGTENGLSRFDGFEFENFGEEELGFNASITSLTVDSSDNILIGTNRTGIFLYKKGVSSLIFEDFPKVAQSNKLILNNTILYTLHSGLHVESINFLENKYLSFDTLSLRNNNSVALCMYETKQGKIYVGRTTGLYYIENGNQYKVTLNGHNDIPIHSILETNTELLISSKNKIYSVKNNSLILKPEINFDNTQTIKDFYQDQNGNLWFSVIGNTGIFSQINGKQINITQTAGLKPNPTTAFFEDREGNIWIAIYGNGVYKFSTQYLFNYLQSAQLKNDIITEIHEDSINILLGTSNGLAIIKNTTDVNFKKIKKEFIEYVRAIAYCKKNEYVIAITDLRLKSFLAQTKIHFDNLLLNFINASALHYFNDTLIIGNWDNKIFYYHFKDLNNAFDSISVYDQFLPKGRINKILKDEEQNLWIGTQRGLCILKNNKSKSFPLHKIFKSEIKQIELLKNRAILIVSSSGFAIFDLNKKWKIFDKENLGNIRNLTCVKFINNTDCFIGTLNGLYFCSQKDTIFIDVNNGLPSNQINNLSLNSNESKLTIGTDEGISQLNINNLEASFFYPSLIITKSFINNVKENISNNYNISYSQNILLKFTSFYFSNPHALRFQYKLDDQDWMDTRIREVQFASLSAGHHLVKFRASILPGKWGKETLVEIYVSPPYYQTGWFYLVIGLSVTGLISLFIKKRIEYLAHKHNEHNIIQQKFNEYEQKALASNLNPHFIFNALNSIQLFVNTREINEANNYLSKFSKLIRMHLNQANHSFILMSDEIVRLRYYLDLESMRFGDKMTYSIEIDPNLNPDYIEIPNMIIQPFVENAIWHGIMPLSTPGHIGITIRPGDDDILEIRITDNGIGKENSRKFQREMHQSKGIEMINERLRLLDEEKSQIIEFKEYTTSVDLPGTLVMIKLTKKMYNKKVKIDQGSFSLTR